VLGDPTLTDPARIKRLIACSGKIYYDLVHARAERGADTVAIARIEQLYPFPAKALAAECKRYPGVAEIVWAQDEPQNQGPWPFVQQHLLEAMSVGQKLAYAGRPASASPAVGYYAKHAEQLKSLIDVAFGKFKGIVLNK